MNEPIIFQNEKAKIEPAWFVNGVAIPAGNRVLPQGLNFIAKDSQTGEPSTISTVERDGDEFYLKSTGPVGTVDLEMWGYVAPADNPRPAPSSELASVTVQIAAPPVLGILVGPSVKA